MYRRFLLCGSFLAVIIFSCWVGSNGIAATNLKSPQPKEVAPPYGKEITVKGLAFIEYFYEEPGYGDDPEHDRMVGACLLKLDDQEKVKHDFGVHILHLIFTQQKLNTCSNLVGHRVRVTGSLEEIQTGHHHGDALLDVLQYSKLR